MVYQLNGKSEQSEENLSEKFDEKDLLTDIITLNDLETDSVRLSASTIYQLFKDTNYNLDDIVQFFEENKDYETMNISVKQKPIPKKFSTTIRLYVKLIKKSKLF